MEKYMRLSDSIKALRQHLHNMVDDAPISQGSKEIYQLLFPKIRYLKSEVHNCHIVCPVCGMSIWAETNIPVNMEAEND